jgi:predicted nuclease of restriction endonuclease-like (RecB) superfamily
MAKKKKIEMNKKEDLSLTVTPEYQEWLAEIKVRIAKAQIKVARAANSELIFFYWELGKAIVRKFEESAWGNKVIEQLAKDLKEEFPNLSGFSRRNLYYIKKFYQFFSSTNSANAIVPHSEAQLSGTTFPQLRGQIPWGHIKIILDKVKNIEDAQFYISETCSNGWSRDVLALQIKSNLYGRQGKAITNFSVTLPSPQSDLAQQTIKDPYTFDFLTMTKPYNERDIENQLIENITSFLLELGKGFAFIGKQYHLTVGDNDYYLDLLFYHIKLRCYVVVELKNTEFKPEYAGKLNFYLSAVDSLLKSENDKPTIGIMLCRDKNKIETEFALRDMNKPMGVSEFIFTEILPDELKSDLPTIEEIEEGLGTSAV